MKRSSTVILFVAAMTMAPAFAAGQTCAAITHSMGGAGTYYLGGKYNDIWAAIAPISGAGGIAEGSAERYKTLPTLIRHGGKDSIVPAANSRKAVAALQAVGAPHIYLEFPDKDHEFWIRRGATQMEKVFLFFSLVSKRTTVTR